MVVTCYIRRMTATKRIIEVDDATAAALETRAAEAGLSVPELLADLVALPRKPAKLSSGDLAELDRQWAAIKAGEPTIPHEDVVRWLDTWGTSAYRPWADR
jgi:predicted transcriptional regulator